MKKLFLLAIVAFGFTAVSFAQGKISATATATIKEAFGITQGSTVLNFGSFAAIAAGKITVAPGATVATFDNVLNTSFAGAITSAEFAINGPISTGYTISLPSVVTTLTSGANSMTILVADWSTSGGLTGTTDPSGNALFKVGAKLGFIADQPAGNYTGTYEVKVNY